MVAVYVQPSGIHSLRFFRQLEIDIYIIFGNNTCTIFRLFECLLNSHSADEVQVDVFRNIQDCFLNEISRIERNEKMSGKSETFRNERNESQVYTFLSVHIQGVK